MQKRTKIFFATTALVAIGSLFAAGISQASGGWRHGWGHGWGKGHMGGRHAMSQHAADLFDKFDADKDGNLTKAELENAVKSRIQGSDTDNDGKLSVSEFESIWLEFSRPFMIKGFQMLDKNADGEVTEGEFKTPLNRIVSHLDSNDDGTVSKKELRRKHKGRYDDDDDDD